MADAPNTPPAAGTRSAAAAAAAPKLVKVRVLSTVQLGRTLHAPGAVIDLPADEAKRLTALKVVGSPKAKSEDDAAAE